MPTSRLAYEQGKAIQDESGDTGHQRDQDEVCREVHAAYAGRGAS